MGIHLFNPPEPCCNPHRRCGNCTGVPNLWKLIFPESFEPPDFENWPGNQPVILRRAAPSSLTLERPCVWSPQFEQASGVPFNDPFSWVLQYQPGLNNPALPDWTISIPGGDGTISYDVAYITSPLSYHDIPEDLDFDAERHFDCLGPNRFWYLHSTADYDGVPDLTLGWPVTLEIEPWYGEVSE